MMLVVQLFRVESGAESPRDQLGQVRCNIVLDQNELTLGSGPRYSRERPVVLGKKFVRRSRAQREGTVGIEIQFAQVHVNRFHLKGFVVRSYAGQTNEALTVVVPRRFWLKGLRRKEIVDRRHPGGFRMPPGCDLDRRQPQARELDAGPV